MPPDSCAAELHVSAIIPCRNAAGTVGLTLDALLQSSLPPAEIICVDDGSEDGTRAVIDERARTSSIPIITISNGPVHAGAAAARNSGARQARYELLLFIDADVVPTREAIETVVNTYHEAAGVAIGMYAETSLQPGVLAHFQAYTVRKAYLSVDHAHSPYLGTHFAMMPRRTFLEIGGFDESYRGATVEDFAFGCQLLERGHTLTLALGATVFHNHAYSWRSFCTNYFKKARDVMGLVLTSPSLRFCHGGYFSRSNWIALAFGGCLALAAAGLIISAPRLIPIFLLLLFLFWSRDLLEVSRRYSAWRSLQFYLLRILVGVLAACGMTTALIKRKRHRLSTPGRQHPYPASKRIVTPAVEYNAAEHCNLRCAGCDHASPFLSRRFADPDSLRRDLEALAAVFHTREFRIVGGEPLLHPKLPELLDIVRQTGIADNVTLITNGVLLHQCDTRIFHLIDTLWVSLYPGVTVRTTVPDLRRLAREHKFRLRLRRTPTFRQTLIDFPHTNSALVEQIFRECCLAHSWSCHTIHDGYYYKCSPAPFLEARLAGRKRTVSNQADGIRIHDNPNLEEELRTYLNTEEPLKACEYCLGSSGRSFPHHQLGAAEIRNGAQCDQPAPESLLELRPMQLVRQRLVRITGAR